MADEIINKNHPIIIATRDKSQQAFDSLEAIRESHHIMLGGISFLTDKEVAERLCASEGSANYGAITASIKLWGNAKITRIVKRNMFVPAPNVDSAIVRIDYEPNKFNISDISLTKQVIRSAFNMRRKTLANNLKTSFNLSSEQIINILADATGRDTADFSDASQNLFESGLLDSMATVSLLLGLQDAFGVQVPVSEFDRSQWDTIEKIEERVKELQNA